MAKVHKVSPFAPVELAEPPPIKGVRLAVAEAGVKYANRTDVLLMVFPEGTEAGGVLTRSKTCSAPVDWCRAQLHHGSARALVVNSGNANAFTGWRGREAVEATAAYASEATDCEAQQVFIASTGVIGEPLDASKFKDVLKEMAGRAREELWADAARAIMTTDTFPKLATRRALVGEATVTLNGIAKGSGMIAPDMATMLSFIVTDAPIESHALTKLLQRHTKPTFNSITVDSDTSTSDTLLIFATGEAAARGAPKITSPDDPEAAAFSAALLGLLHDLSMQVIKDGEGISKLMTVHVEGAESDDAARRIALAIGNSPLVKTAIAGEDANWGRVVAAIGKAGEAANRDRLAIWFGDIQVAKNGMRHPDYDEAHASAYMKNAEIEIRVDAGVQGAGRATIWASDLTHGYIDINADYRS